MEKGLEKMVNVFVIKNGVVLNKQIFTSIEDGQNACGLDATLIEVNEDNNYVREGYLWDGVNFSYAEPVYQFLAEEEPVLEETVND